MLGNELSINEYLTNDTLAFSQVASATINGFVNCSCNHLTSFGGSFLVKPNPIDLDEVFVEFKRLGETGNVAVVVTIAVVFSTYFVVLIIVRKADRKDAARVQEENDRYPTILCNFRFHKNGGFPSTRGRFWVFSTWMFSEVTRCCEVSEPFTTTLRSL